MERALVSLALSGLGRDALKVAAGLALAVLLALAFAISSLLALTGVAARGPAGVATRLDEVPVDQLAVMQAAATTCGLPWQVLAAIAKVESDFGRNMATSSAGAIGYGQFLPSSWAAYGNGGNPYDYRDALPAMARYLCAHGGPADLRRALFAYNRAEWYVNDVLAIAAGYGYGLADAPGGSGPADWVIAFGFDQPYDRPFNAAIPRHRGVDIQLRGAPNGGQGRAYAPFVPGIVVAVTQGPYGGNGVILRDERGLFHRYFHNERVLVRPGQAVERSTPLAVVGDTGSPGFPHVHFEVSRSINGDPMGQLIDPRPFMGAAR